MAAASFPCLQSDVGGRVERWCALAVGAGSSALATWLFTLAFGGGDPLTPLVLQKLQPLIAILAARLFLGERIRGRFWFFAVPALIGTWLIAFADPLHIQLKGAEAALLAIGAAVLWAAGTVLGRRLSVAYAPTTVTTLRYAVGLPASLVIAVIVGGPFTVALADVPGLAGLALIPGLLALSLYYRGLQRTPAARATLAELAFPRSPRRLLVWCFCTPSSPSASGSVSRSWWPR